MCMEVRKIEQLKESLTVYAVRYINKNGHISSPFVRNVEWKLRSLKSLEKNKKIKKSCFGKTILTDGVFHCLENLEEAMAFIGAIKQNNRSGIFQIFRANIPKDTWVARGIIVYGYIGSGLSSIGSRRLKLTKMIKEYELIKRGYVDAIDWYGGTSASTSLRGSTTGTHIVYNTGSTT